MRQTLLATYETLERANRAVSDLVSAGYNRSDIGLAVLDRGGKLSRYLGENGNVSDDVKGGDGVGFGAIIGTLVGAVAGLVAITIPGIGPILAAGPLSALGGAAAGAGVGALAGGATGGITAALLDFGVPEEEAGQYAESLRRGGALVSVTVRDGDSIQSARDLLQRHDPMDIDQHVTQWRKEGWSGFDPLAEPFTAVDRERKQLEENVAGSYDDVKPDYGTSAIRNSSDGPTASDVDTGAVVGDSRHVRVYTRD